MWIGAGSSFSESSSSELLGEDCAKSSDEDDSENTVAGDRAALSCIASPRKKSRSNSWGSKPLSSLKIGPMPSSPPTVMGSNDDALPPGGVPVRPGDGSGEEEALRGMHSGEPGV
jgi:hypothetical protein